MSAQPSEAYLTERLSDSSFVAIAGFSDELLVGGLVGYVLRKFEQERSEIYIYDLAVLDGYRRRLCENNSLRRVKLCQAA